MRNSTFDYGWAADGPAHNWPKFGMSDARPAHIWRVAITKSRAQREPSRFDLVGGQTVGMEAAWPMIGESQTARMHGAVPGLSSLDVAAGVPDSLLS